MDAKDLSCLMPGAKLLYRPNPNTEGIVVEFVRYEPVHKDHAVCIDFLRFRVLKLEFLSRAPDMAEVGR